MGCFDFGKEVLSTANTQDDMGNQALQAGRKMRPRRSISDLKYISLATMLSKIWSVTFNVFFLLDHATITVEGF